MAEKLVYSRRELADALGVSLPSIDRWKRAGILHQTKIGGRVVFTLAEVERLLVSANATEGGR